MQPQCGFIGAKSANRPQSTILNYKNLSEDESSSSSNAVRPKRTKLKPPKRSSRKRFIQVPKQLSTEAELAHHVQTVYSGEDFDELLVGGGDGEQVCNDVTKKLERHPALVLNADYQPLRMLPLSIWSWQNAVKAVLGGKAVVVETYPDVVIRAVSIDMPVPSVIALREYAPSGKVKPAFTRRNVFLRDGYRCQYCTGLFRTAELSLDHVEPRCFGGKLTWENTVTSCKKCNGRKGCLRPSQIHTVGMTLHTKPRCPSLYELAACANKFVPRKVPRTWAPFLGIDMEDGDMMNPPSPGNGSSLPRP
jgi:5-methylcytosine-specific restriction endonuclease McrA